MIKAIHDAFDVGYRSIDTASEYFNERGVGEAIRACGLAREDIFLTTKLWNEDQRKHRTMAAFEESLDRLQVDYIDLYLVHWPVEEHLLETWSVMEEIYGSGRARAFGVSNFQIRHLEQILDEGEIVPGVNQIEFHPYLVQSDLLGYCQCHDIQVEAWSPLVRGQILTEPLAQDLAGKYDKTAAQIILRWDLQHEVVTIPKSVRPHRIAENADIFDFELSTEEMKALDALDEARRSGPDPYNFSF